MKAQRGFLVSMLMLISLSALGFCQNEDDDDNNIPPESYPTLPSDWSPTAGFQDMKSKTAPLFDLIPTSPKFASKVMATSEPQVEATTQPVEPEPTKEPELEEADFQYSEGEGPVCVRACLRAALDIKYKTYDEEGNEVPEIATLPLSNKAQVGGRCGDKEIPSQLKLQWGGGKYFLKFQFEKTRSGDTDNWIATSIEFTYDTRDTTYFEGAINPGPQTVRVPPKSEFFESPWKKSYICKSDDSIMMVSDDKSAETTLRIDEIQLQAFMQPENNGTFSEGEPCENDKTVKPTSNVASVAVGATLGCLILIVIIVYAVGRRMGSITDRTGYKAVD